MTTKSHELRRNALHLVVLSAFAVSQPLLDILGRNPTFFVARDSSALEIVLFTLALVLMPPAALFAIEVAATLVNATAGRVVHLAAVAALCALIALHALTRTESLSGAAAVAAATGIGVLATAVYARVSAARALVSVLAPVPVVFAALFLFTSQTSNLVLTATPVVHAANVKSTTSVVVVVFDEFSTVGLMDGKQRVDARRFPNFAALARDSTWFRSATTEYGMTEGAVPSILTGRTPDPTRAPVYAQYPENIFTLLGTRYRMRAIESLTTLCPRSLCRRTDGRRVRVVDADAGALASDAGIVYLRLVVPKPYVDRVPAIDESWGNFGQRADAGAERVTADARACGRYVCEFTKLIDRKRRPTLYLLHTLLPHVPYEYLPSGRRYALDAPRLRGMRGGRWADREETLRSQQRYLLQLGYADRALGLILRRLRATGVYNRSLVIVTADHGVSFRRGQPRRLATPQNLDDVAFVPLFVKVPGQRRARVVDTDARTVDVLPTIADVLKIDPPWRLDGRSLLGPRLDRGRTFVIIKPGHAVSSSLSRLRAQRALGLRRKIAAFGTGSFSKAYAIGPSPTLVGRRVAVLARSRGSAKVELAGGALLDAVDPSSGFVPTYVAGTVSGLGRGTHGLAIAVNGRIAATATTTRGAGGSEELSALIPEKALGRGRNAVEIFAIQRMRGRIRLQTLSGTAGGIVLRERDSVAVLERPRRPAAVVEPGAMGGAVTARRSGTSWVFTGWAGNLDAKRPADSFVVLADGREVLRTSASGVRPQRVLGQKSTRLEYSFEFLLPAAVLPQRGSAHAVRVFAVRGRVASEPRYETGYPWRTR